MNFDDDFARLQLQCADSSMRPHDTVCAPQSSKECVLQLP